MVGREGTKEGTLGISSNYVHMYETGFLGRDGTEDGTLLVFHSDC